MTTKQILEQVDSLKPNLYSDAVKKSFLLDIEKQVIEEVMIPHGLFPALWDGSEENAVLVAGNSPYVSLYVYWVIAQIDNSNAEYGRYQNNMEMFNTYYQQYKAYVNRKYKAVSRQRITI